MSNEALLQLVVDMAPKLRAAGVSAVAVNGLRIELSPVATSAPRSAQPPTAEEIKAMQKREAEMEERMQFAHVEGVE